MSEAYRDLDFGGLFSDSISTAEKTTVVDNDVVNSAFAECFEAVCARHKLDTENTTTKSLSPVQKLDLLISLMQKFVDGGHSKATCMALLQKFGVYEETDRTKIWNRTKLAKRNQLLERELSFKVAAVQHKSLVNKLYNSTPEKPLHHNFIAEVGRGRGAKQKVSILAEIGYAPYKAVMAKAAELRKIGKSDDLGGYSEEEFALLYDETMQEIQTVLDTVQAKIDTVKKQITDLFGGSGSRSSASINVDDAALAAFTIGGEIGDDDDESDNE